MYNLQSLIDHLVSDTGYDTAFARAKEMNLEGLDQIIKVKVGYHSVDSDGVLGDGETPDPYQYFAEDLSFSCIVQFTCGVAEFHTVWQSIYDSCSGWIPLDAEKDISGFMYSGGGAMGLKDGRIWWMDRWRIDFPRVSNFQ